MDYLGSDLHRIIIGNDNIVRSEFFSMTYFKDGIDMIQVGSRNSQNFPMLKFLGRTEKPVLLKNGMGNSTDEWMGAAEYILSGEQLIVEAKSSSVLIGPLITMGSELWDYVGGYKHFSH